MKQITAILAFILGSLVALPAVSADKPAPAQKSTQEEVQIALDKIKADKKFLTSSEMQLTDAEAKAFWPLYDEYQAGLQQLNQRIQALLTEYAGYYRNQTMNNEKANKLLADMMAIEKDELALKQTIVPKLQRAIPGVKVARYMQIENKMRALVKFQLADKIPLVR